MSFSSGSRWGLALALGALAAQGCVRIGINRSAPAAQATTTVIVVRHAEKSSDDPRDPSLTDAGRERAAALRDALKDAGIGSVYSTQYKRNRETAEPLARHFGLTVIERPVNAGNSATYPADLAREVLAANPGKTVVVVGHSNTVPQIVQAFSGIPIKPMQDSEYDHFFVINVSTARAPQLIKVRFGRPAP